MRLIAWICTGGALIAIALAGQMLWRQISTPAALPSLAMATQNSDPQAPDTAPQPRNWPYLFGEPKPPAPPQPPSQQVAEPQPPKPPKPPLSALGYQLNGVVRAGETTWAMMSHPTGDRLLRVGDMLDSGIKVTEIATDGIWISRDEDAPEFLAFEAE